MNKLFLVLFAAVLSISVMGETASVTVPGTVNVGGDSPLNLRLAPGLNSPVVGKVANKSELRICRVVGSWLEVEAPENLKIYVSEVRIGKDGVLIGELNMRSAMDVKAPCLGVLPKGTKVEKMDEGRNGWVRIKVPAGVKVYAAAFFVKYDYRKFDAKGNVITAPAAKAPQSVEKPETPAEKKEENAAEKKDAAAAETVQVEGVLTKWKYAESKETAFALLSYANGYCNAFVYSDDEAGLAANENKKIKVSGKVTGKVGENGTIIVKVDTITVL